MISVKKSLIIIIVWTCISMAVVMTVFYTTQHDGPQVYAITPTVAEAPTETIQ